MLLGNSWDTVQYTQSFNLLLRLRQIRFSPTNEDDFLSLLDKVFCDRSPNATGTTRNDGTIEVQSRWHLAVQCIKKND